MARRARYGVAWIVVIGTVAASWSLAAMAKGIRVPLDEPTIQAGIDAAKNGDTVLVSQGVYQEYLRIEGKTITLASHYHTTGDRTHIEKTILDGGPNAREQEKELIFVGSDVGNDAKIIGFTFQNAEDGMVCEAMIHVLHNRFTKIFSDAIDYEDGGGICAHNVFEDCGDDAIDLDGASAGIFEHNTIKNMDNDGIEIRLHEYNGPPLTVTIRHNVIVGCKEDGIQLIDYPGVSPRTYHIERNLIVKSAMAGIGCMSDGNTDETYEAASIPERVYIVNNTLVDNEYGLTGGDNFLVLNNIFLNTKMTALKHVDGKSLASHNLICASGMDIDGSNVARTDTLLADPRLDTEYKLSSESPCIDAGAAEIQWQEVTYAVPRELFRGSAPDLGANEFEAARVNE